MKYGDQYEMAGGRIVAEGTPEEITACAASYTGQSLRKVLEKRTERVTLG